MCLGAAASYRLLEGSGDEIQLELQLTQGYHGPFHGACTASMYQSWGHWSSTNPLMWGIKVMWGIKRAYSNLVNKGRSHWGPRSGCAWGSHISASATQRMAIVPAAAHQAHQVCRLRDMYRGIWKREKATVGRRNNVT
jgi:hypothetical protein